MKVITSAIAAMDVMAPVWTVNSIILLTTESLAPSPLLCFLRNKTSDTVMTRSAVAADVNHVRIAYWISWN